MARRQARVSRREGSGGWRGLANLLHELGQLKRVRRSGWWLAGIDDPESVAEHTFRTAAIAFFLADLEGADPHRAAALALFHDLAETRLNDAHRLQRSYQPPGDAAARVLEDQLRGLPPGPRTRLRGLFEEQLKRRSIEARVAKDADRLECLVQALEYAAAGHDVREWQRSSLAELATTSARRLARALLATTPAAWRRTPRRASRRGPPGRRGR